MENQINIPEFKTIEDMANFWDSHDITDFEGELKEVQKPVFKLVPGRVISIMLAPGQYKELKNIADQKNVSASSLVNKWIVKHIKEETPHLHSG